MSDHPTVGLGPAVLDIGGDVGALVLYTGPSLEGREVHLHRVDDPSVDTHSQVHRRTVDGRTVHAAVFVSLREGRYRLADEAATELRVTGGRVTEHHWP